MHTRTLRVNGKRLLIKLSVPLVIAFAYCACGAAHAAMGGPAKPFDKGLNLRLDMGLPPSGLIAQEDCDDGDLLMQSVAAGEPLPVLALADQANSGYEPSSSMPADTSQSWDIVPADKTLNSALARWAKSAGWQLLWELPVDYAVEAKTTVPGTFEEAVGTVAKSMDTAEIPMKAIFYAGNRVLRIVVKGIE